jgi:type IV pilus assembly protein PilM
MSDSVWKKEISFKRKPKGDEPAPAAPAVAEAPKQSLLKKEISFSRKPKAPKPAKAAKEPKAEKQSFLKKEISFGKPKAPKEPKAKKQSFLKKEISLSRKKQDRELERLVHEAEQSVSPSFVPNDVPPAETAPTALAEAAVAAMVEADAAANAAPEPAFVEHALVESTFVEHAQVEPVVEPTFEPVALAAVPDPEPVELHAVPSASDPAEGDVHPVEMLPVDETPAPPPAAAVSTLSPAIVAASASVDEPPLPAEPVAAEPAFEEWPEPAVGAPAPAEPWLTEPELPPAPEAPAAVVVHPPVPAAELPPLPENGAKTPFWKKELSLSRKPKAEKAPKAERAPKQSSSAPFWKKELGRKKSQAPAEDVTVDAPTEALPVVAAAPFWKKKLSFSKPSLSLPSRSGGGKGGHGAKRLVGLKIGSSQIAAARVSNNGVAEVLQLVREPLATGVVVGGELRDPDALGEALKGFFARNKLPRKGVRLGIASNRIGVRIFDIVGVAEEKQLANAIQFRAQEALPIPLDEAVLDYRVLDESTDAEGQSVKRVLLVVAYRELVDRYVSACRKAGIQLAGIDLEAFALLRSLGSPEDRGSSALVAVSIGYDRSTFAVSDGRVCEFTRVLEWGGSALNVALARVFDSTPSEVEAIKRGLSLDGTTVPPGLTEEQTAQALDAVRRQVQSFARELVSSLQFYQNQPGSLGIGEIVLTGGTTHLQGLSEELERLIGVHVRVGDPLARVKISKKLAGADQIGSLAVAIGLGIED